MRNPGYGQHVHFIGHSFGTIVNRYACDYLHAWIANATTPHVTLLDEAGVGSVAGNKGNHFNSGYCGDSRRLAKLRPGSPRRMLCRQEKR